MQPSLSKSAVLGEMKKRGLIEPDSAVSEPTLNFDEIKSEMKKRGISEPDQSNNSFLGNVVDHVKPFVKGIGLGLLGTGLEEGKLYNRMGVMPVGKGFSPIPHDPSMEENIDKTLKTLNDTEGYSPVQKGLHNAGNFTGGMLGFPVFGVSKGATSGVKMAANHLKNSLKIGAPVGAVSSMAQEFGIHPLLSDIGASVIAPAAAKKIGRGIAYPFSSKIRDRILEEKTTKGLKQVVQKIMKENPEKELLGQTAHLPSEKEILSQLELGSVVPEEAGIVVRNTIDDILKKRQDVRRKATKKAFGKLKNLEDVDLTDIAMHLEEELPFLYGDPRNRMIYHLDHLNADKKKVKIDKKILSQYKELVDAGVHPDFLKEIELQIFGPGGKEGAHSVLTNPRKAVEMYKTLGSEARAASNIEGRGDIKFKIDELRGKLSDVLKRNPEVFKPIELYKKHSRPIDEITKHPVFKKIVEPGEIADTYKISAGAVPKTILNSSMQSVDTARDLIKLVGKNKEALKMLKGYQYGELLESTTNVDSNVVPSKIKTWIRNNPGAFEIDPSLKTKLATLSNAKFFKSEMEKKMGKMNLLEVSEFLPIEAVKKLGAKKYGANYAYKILTSMKKVRGEEMIEKLIEKGLTDSTFFEALKTPLDKHAFWKKHGERLIHLIQPIVNDLKPNSTEEYEENPEE